MLTNTEATETSAGSETDAAIAEYTAGASQLTCVAAILTTPTRGGLSLWVVLAGDPGGEARRALHDLQLVTWERYPAAEVMFRVLDLAEYPDTPPSALLPSDAQRLYIRPGANL